MIFHQVGSVFLPFDLLRNFLRENRQNLRILAWQRLSPLTTHHITPDLHPESSNNKMQDFLARYVQQDSLG